MLIVINIACVIKTANDGDMIGRKSYEITKQNYLLESHKACNKVGDKVGDKVELTTSPFKALAVIRNNPNIA